MLICGRRRTGTVRSHGGLGIRNWTMLCFSGQPCVLPIAPPRLGFWPPGRRHARLRGPETGVLGKVELRSAAPEAEGGFVVRPGGGLGGREGAEPDAGRLVRIPDLRRPFAPRPLSNTSVLPSFSFLRQWRRGRGGFCHRSWSSMMLVCPLSHQLVRLPLIPDDAATITTPRWRERWSTRGSVSCNDSAQRRHDRRHLSRPSMLRKRIRLRHRSISRRNRLHGIAESGVGVSPPPRTSSGKAQEQHDMNGYV